LDDRRFAAARRALLGRLVMSGIAALPLTPSVVEVAAKKKKNRRKTPCPALPPTPTCPGSCPGTCLICFTRPDAPPLCGDGRNLSGCLPCVSDMDCVGTDQPYCTTQRTEVATGVTRRWDDLCPPYTVGICTRILDCNDI
jgi:hypothetical protein